MQVSTEKSFMQRLFSNTFVYIVVFLICLMWSIPTLGLFVSSFREPAKVNSSGWWTVFLPRQDNPQWLQRNERVIALNQTRSSTLEQLETARADAENEVEGAADQVSSLEARIARFDEAIAEAEADRDEVPESIPIFSKEWRDQWTLDNYNAVLTAEGMENAFLNSLLVVIPSVVIPITIAAFAAYAFAWLAFPGRDFLFALVVVSMVIPLHTALIPILSRYTDIDLNGTYLGIWLAHTGFGMPLAIYLLYGYIATIPKEIMEAAHIDGASPFTAFTRLILPLSVPAIASFAIFQFLWVWNDLLVALVFLGTNQEVQVVTAKLSELVGSRGQDWEVLTAGAFITMTVPLLVFFALQRYFVRGMMAGSVKG